MTKKKGGKKGKQPEKDESKSSSEPVAGTSQPAAGTSQPAAVIPQPAETHPKPQSSEPFPKLKGLGRGQAPAQKERGIERGGGDAQPRRGGIGRGDGDAQQRGGFGRGCVVKAQQRTPGPPQQVPTGLPPTWGPQLGGVQGVPALSQAPQTAWASPRPQQAQRIPPGFGAPSPQPQVPLQQEQQMIQQQMQQLHMQQQQKLKQQQQSPPQQQQRPPQQQQQRPPQQQQRPPQQQPSQQSSASTSTHSAPPTSTITSAELAKYASLIPCRKNPQKAGTQGRKITVEANVVSITFNENFNPYAVHYDVAFDPDKPRFMMRPAYEEVRKRHFSTRHPAYDGRKNLFSAGNLPFGEMLTDEIQVWDPERAQERTYKVAIKKVADVDLSWLKSVAAGFNGSNQTALQVIDVVLRNGPSSRCVQVGRSFFHPPKGHVANLTGGLELWVGMFQSAILGWKPYLNLDVAHKGFPKSQKVVELMEEIVGTRSRFDAQSIDKCKSQISKYLKGLKVVYEIPGQPTSKRTHRVNELVGSASRETFKLDSGQMSTVTDYFLKEKGYRIKHPDFPCVWIGGRNRQIYVPAELCTIIGGQVTMKKMDENQTAEMIKHAATNVEVRKKKIMDAFQSIKFNDDPSVKEFGLSVGGGFEKVPARVLEPPQLLYERPIRVNKGVWRASKFNAAANLEPKSWTILNLDQYTKDRELYRLQEELIRNGSQAGMSLGEALTPFTTLKTPYRDVREVIDFFQRNKELKLVIVVVPDRGNTYSKVKQIAELQIGVLTQCIRCRTLQRLSPATTGNLLLKINSKLNGVNHTFLENIKPPCLREPCIIIGADVTHPSPDATDIPSIAAVAASHDPKAFKYNIKIQLQPPREEIILDLERIIREQLMLFYKATSYKPQRIIFYRDGVSEGQFPQVMSKELSAIKRACKGLQKDGSYQPPITFLVVQKRHHVRLFPTDPSNSDDRNGNVQAGTVVDTMITHPSHIDFYLVSHASIQGVARPTKYRCLWDDKDMSEDEIEQLTYYLCHMFSRCTRSVSYPAPTYYAHLAAYRARVLIEDIPINIHNLDEEQRKKLTLAAQMLTKPMFFV